MEIKFYIPSDWVVPIDLWLTVDDIKVSYKRIEHGFSFEVYEPDSDKAKAIVDAVIEQMLIDHDETQHGVSWRTVSFEEVENVWDGSHIYEWRYRIRDSY